MQTIYQHFYYIFMEKNATELQPIGRASSSRPSQIPNDMRRNSSIIESYQTLKGKVENQAAAEKSRKTSKLEKGQKYTPRPDKKPGNCCCI